MPVASENRAADRLAEEVEAAKQALVEVAEREPEREWRALDLKTAARNGWDPAVMSIALAGLIRENRFEVGARLVVRLVAS